MFGAAGKHDRVEIAAEITYRHALADMRIHDELHAFTAHLVDTAIDQVLLHLEIRNAITQKAADAISLFENGNGVAGARELLGSGEACGPGSDNGDAFAGMG
jgi:hypothetical protein